MAHSKGRDEVKPQIEVDFKETKLDTTACYNNLNTRGLVVDDRSAKLLLKSLVDLIPIRLCADIKRFI